MNKTRLLPLLVPSIVAATAIITLVTWYECTRPPELSERLPGADKAPSSTKENTKTGPAFGSVTTGDGAPSQISGTWPRFRGPQGDGISRESIPLATSWAKTGPPVLWETELGEGYAGAAVRNGCVYLMDYDQKKRMDALRCLSLDDGREIWRFAYPVVIKRNHGMSRTVPAVTDKYVVAMGPKCHVTCVDAKTGMMKWFMDLVKDYGATTPPWYAGQCPLIDDGRAILAPGGPALMMAVDCDTGKILWRTPNPHGWKMTHSSIVPLTFQGMKMYIYCGSGGVVGVSATDGGRLWETASWKISIANVPTPVPLPGGRIFFSGGYNAGAMMLQLKKEKDAFAVDVLYRLKPAVFGSDQQTPIYFNDKIYGVIPGGMLACLALSGEQLWTSGRQHRFGLGPYIISARQKLMWLLNDKGTLTLVDLAENRYKQLAQARVLQGHDSWAPLAIAGGRLLARDFTRLVCLDLRKRAQGPQP